MNGLRTWGIRILIVLLGVLWLALVGTSWATAAETRGEGDEYSFKWLDPEKKIYVLQNRRYTKSDHAELSVLGGLGLSNPYQSVYNVEGRFGYWFREDLGVEVFYTRGFSSNNNTYRALKATGAASPVVREMRSQYGALLSWAPWYAKINVFNKILYFDWYFAAGAGTVGSYVDSNPSGAANFVPADLFAIYVATGHQYYINESLLIRLDLTNGIYQAPLQGTTGEQTWYSNLNFGIGVGLRL